MIRNFVKILLRKRSAILIANFVDDYAKGWVFNVGKWFKNELDIKLTERIQSRKKVLVWTQGPFLCFDTGHLFYHGKNPNLSCQIQRAVPCSVSEDGNLILGNVTFILSKYKNGAYFANLGLFHLNQWDFVAFLYSGKMKTGMNIFQNYIERRIEEF